MSFWDDLNGFLGYGKNSENAWEKLLNETTHQPTPLIEGIQPESLAPIGGSDPTQSPFWQPTADIDRLVQLTPQPFQTIDINPPDFALNFANRCVVDQGVLRSTFNELDGSSGGAIDEGGPWRSIQIGVAGTFLKLEVKGAGQNTWTPVGTGRNPSSNNIGKFNNYQAGIGTSVGNYQQNSERNYVVSFNVTNAPPLIARDGDTFECPFTTVYISFKTLAAPFRITIGNNARIKSSVDKRIVNSNIAFGPGYGLWENISAHAVPFCITQDNFQDASFGPGAGESIANTTLTRVLITNDSTQNIATRNCPTGQAVLWITEVFVLKSSGGAIRNLWALVKFDNSTSVINQTIYEVLQNPSNSGQFQPPIYLNPSFPTRVNLYQRESLALIINDNGTDNFSWMVKGYIIGGLIAPAAQSYAIGGLTSNRGLINGSFGAFPRVVFDTDPFPFDNDTGTALF